MSIIPDDDALLGNPKGEAKEETKDKNNKCGDKYSTNYKTYSSSNLSTVLFNPNLIVLLVLLIMLVLLPIVLRDKDVEEFGSGGGGQDGLDVKTGLDVKMDILRRVHSMKPNMPLSVGLLLTGYGSVTLAMQMLD